MNFYKRFVGDIQAKTGHLSLAEFGAYDRLLDHYYSTERGLPADLDRCCGIARAFSKEDRRAVEFVLKEFFRLSEAGLYHQRRADEMIAEAQPKIEAARTNGSKGGRPKRPKPETQEKPTGFQNETQHETESADFAKASQSQSQSIGIQPHVAKDENSVCVSGHTQNFEQAQKPENPENRSPGTELRGEFFAEVAKRPELDGERVWRMFCEHYPPEKRSLSKWSQWVQNERIPGAISRASSGGVVVPLVVASTSAEATRAALEASREGVGPPSPEVRQQLEALRASMPKYRGAFCE